MNCEARANELQSEMERGSAQSHLVVDWIVAA